MSHQVLARKWRPKSFAEVISQPHVVQALTNALNHQYLHHAYLFTGTRGIGKTTIARIIAKCLNCEQGVSATPCGICTACQEVDAGRFIDLIEVDAASRTKVEDTREILDNVQYAPTRGRYKVYLIDEVHMLSGHSFNALLKTLEEPPPHVKFLLATTDPQKLPATVLSRCLQFHLTPMCPETIAEHLQTVLQTENIEFETPALLALGKAATGSMRDALSLLDQSIAYGNNKVFYTDIKNMLGLIEPTAIYDILNALVTENANALLNAAHQLALQGADFAHALAELLTCLHQIATTQIAPNVLQDTHPTINELAAKLNAEKIQLYYQIALLGQRDLHYAPTQQIGFEMVLMRMLAFTPQKNTEPTRASNKSTAVTPAATTPRNTTASVDMSSWNALLAKLNLTGPTAALAELCTLKEMDEHTLTLLLTPNHQAMLNDRHIQRIEDAIKNTLNKSMKVHIKIKQHQQETPAQIKQREQVAYQQSLETEILDDQHVQKIMRTFDATLIKDSITPITEH